MYPKAIKQNKAAMQYYVDSSRKCNFGSRLKEQAAVAVLVFSNTTYQRTRNELHAAYLRARLSDCYPQESGAFSS